MEEKTNEELLREIDELRGEKEELQSLYETSQKEVESLTAQLKSMTNEKDYYLKSYLASEDRVTLLKKNLCAIGTLLGTIAKD